MVQETFVTDQDLNSAIFKSALRNEISSQTQNDGQSIFLFFKLLSPYCIFLVLL